MLFQQFFHKSSKFFFLYKSCKAVNNFSIFYSQNSGNPGDLSKKTKAALNVTVLVVKFRPDFLYLIVTFWYASAGISGEFGRAMVRILARRSWAKIPMARPNEPDVPPKRTTEKGTIR